MGGGGWGMASLRYEEMSTLSGAAKDCLLISTNIMCPVCVKCLITFCEASLDGGHYTYNKVLLLDAIQRSGL